MVTKEGKLEYTDLLIFKTIPTGNVFGGRAFFSEDDKKIKAETFPDFKFDDKYW